MALANAAIDPGVLKADQLEEWLQKLQIEQWVQRVVFRVVPLGCRVLNLTDAVQIAIYFL